MQRLTVRPASQAFDSVTVSSAICAGTDQNRCRRLVMAGLEARPSTLCSTSVSHRRWDNQIPRRGSGPRPQNSMGNEHAYRPLYCAWAPGNIPNQMLCARRDLGGGSWYIAL